MSTTARAAMSKPIVAIVGRTNVGKSTLFNALLGRRQAIVEDTPGVTRDRNYRDVQRGGISFTLVDTGGLVGEEGEDSAGISGISQSVRAQTEVAIAESALVLVLFDGLSGPLALDREVVDILRRSGKETLWIVNKCEKPINEILAAEFYALGLEELHFISAAHRRGMDELMQAIKLKLEPQDPAAAEEPAEQDLIKVAIIGKPNVGKSTLVNKILGAPRLICSELPGTTRDSIDTELTRNSQKYLLIDTAGLRKKAKVAPQSLERFSNLRTLRAVARADVIVLLLDATQGAPAEQDKKITDLINERGKSLIIVVNKWDAVEKNHRSVKTYETAVFQTLKFVHYAPLVFVSALSGRRCPAVLDTARRVFEEARQRIPTAELNKIMNYAFQHNPPPVYRGEPIKLFFATQIGVAPPRIVLFLNRPDKLGDPYQRYLKRELRSKHAFAGTDIKLELRKRSAKSNRQEMTGDEPETIPPSEDSL